MLARPFQASLINILSLEQIKDDTLAAIVQFY